MNDLVLIHGWGVGSYVWAPLLEALAVSAPRCRIHLFDLPGYGSAVPDSGSFVAQAQKLLATLPPDCTLCGWSLGALFALQMAQWAPQQIRRLVLVGASPCFMQREDWPQAQPPALLDGFIQAIGDQPEATLQRFIALLNQGDTQAKRIGRLLRQGLLATPLPDRDSLLQGLGYLRDLDLRAAVPAIRTPTLLIHGEHDPLMPVAAAHWLQAALPMARLENFADAAHAPFLNDPERFARLLGEYADAS